MNRHFSVLIIDDEPLIRNGIQNILVSEFGSEALIYQAMDGRKGLEAAISLKPDLIISDIVMPEMTGLEVIRELKVQGLDIPTIMISGYDEFNYAKEAIRLGVLNYILKPINKDELLDTIRRIDINRSIRRDDEATILNDARAHFLTRLITGEIKSEEEALKGVKTLKLEIKGSNYIAVSIKCSNEDMDKLLESLSEENILNIKHQSMLIAIFSADATYAIHEVGLLIKDMNAIAGIGKPVDKLSLLHISYQYSLQTLSYSIYHPDEKVITEDYITNGKPEITPSDIDTIALRNLILENNEVEIRGWIDSFYRQMLLTGTLPPPSYIKGMSIFVISDLQKNLTENLAVPKELFMEMNAALLNSIYRLGELKDWMLQQLLHISNDIIPEARIANMPEIHMAKKYIENNLDRIVSSNEIAEKLGMNPTYFSTFFKQKTGENFRNYVNRIKNDKAIEMLALPDLSIEEIAHNLGYTDYRSFHRIFKQMNGESPTTYRKKITKGKQE